MLLSSLAMTEARHALIVGAGIFGLTGALALLRRGWRVTVVDPGPVPQPLAASTDLSKLVRMDYGADALYVEAMRRALEGWRRWNAQRGTAFFHETGLLVLSSAPLAPGTFEHESYTALSARGLPVERLDPRTLSARHPAWVANRFADGYFNPVAGWAESGVVIAWLAERVRAEGAVILEGVACQGLEETGGSAVLARFAAGDTLAADLAVVAAGAWTPSLLPELSDRLHIVGQPVLHFRPESPDPFLPPAFPPWCADIATTGWYGFPCHPTGVVKVANHGPGTPLHPDAAREVPPAQEAAFRVFLHGALPTLAAVPLAGRRLCLYCDTPDGDFLIARLPDRPRVVVATGGSGHAFKFAPVLGDWIADAAEGRTSPELARFAWRAPIARAEAARAR